MGDSREQFRSGLIKLLLQFKQAGPIKTPKGFDVWNEKFRPFRVQAQELGLNFISFVAELESELGKGHALSEE